MARPRLPAPGPGLEHTVRRRALALGVGASLILPGLARANRSGAPAALPRLGRMPAFTLTDQDGRRVPSWTWQGRVVALTFVFTGCSQTCPLLTAKLVGVQRALGAGPDAQFVAITLDPLNDTPITLKRYAQAHRADPRFFTFLTGSLREIDAVVAQFSVTRRADGAGGIDHAFLTTLVDRTGAMRARYTGSGFDTDAFLGDLRALLSERSFV